METHLRDGYPRYLPDDLGAFIADGSALRAWVAELDGRPLREFVYVAPPPPAGAGL